MIDKTLSNAAQLASPAYVVPALDEAFLLGDSMRGARLMLEYAKAEERLRAAAIRSTLVVFGSARAREGGPGRQEFWYDEARAFGQVASREGGALDDHADGRFNVIATGGGPGLMEAANRGARDVGAPSVGFNISLPREQQPNGYTTPELTFRFHYFAMRKMHFAMRASALAVFPGGFGTIDELFEVLTLVQTGKAPKLPIVLVDKAYWTRIIDFDALKEAGMVGAADIDLLRFADTGVEAWRVLKEMGLRAP
jgi:uncharacterized protein (TIGR00730 family)